MHSVSRYFFRESARLQKIVTALCAQYSEAIRSCLSLSLSPLLRNQHENSSRAKSKATQQRNKRIGKKPSASILISTRKSTGVYSRTAARLAHSLKGFPAARRYTARERESSVYRDSRKTRAAKKGREAILSIESL